MPSGISSRIDFRFIVLMLCVCHLWACGGKASQSYRYQTRPKMPEQAVKKYTLHKQLARIGYAIQAGAFAKVDNAARLTEQLCQKGLNATYFRDLSGLYKVRFGSFGTKVQAKARADNLVDTGMIDAYYIVAPQDQAAAKAEEYGPDYLRDEIIKTAETFIDVPYLWGGNNADKGFDCSGLTMAVYQLNGLKLPRTSGEQFESGEPVGFSDLQKGDLVFFATRGGSRVAHVGIYAGGGWFIHAPGTGKKIRADSFDSDYYKERFIGARSYL